MLKGIYFQKIYITITIKTNQTNIRSHEKNNHSIWYAVGWFLGIFPDLYRKLY